MPVKSAATYPVPDPGKVTEVNVKYLPADKPCEVLLTVTVAELFVVVKVNPVMAVSNGEISKKLFP